MESISKNSKIQMFTNTRAESFVGIIVWIFILSFVILWITNLLIASQGMSEDFNQDSTLVHLQQNSYNILDSLDLSILNSGENFYLYKNIPLREYQVLTGASNLSFQYIDAHMQHVSDISSYQEDIYTLTGQVYKYPLAWWGEDIIYNISLKAYRK